ncbi:AAA family ATPase [Actinoplanes sp. M2I2]|uniref:ATP-binding protein n=1 Tax=Actinoplanes sp. M2I2 TaxID=1734444 RepID=UPI002021DE95|nr:LuxR family transcriptional regulator [Actinoplanes sp. M2I2]
MAADAERRPAGLLGRQAECAALDRLLDDVTGGSGRALVVRGEEGSGKSALLTYATGRAGKFQVLPVAGVESEQEMPYGGLHQLCAPLLLHLDQLPAPQRDALAVVFGLGAGPPPDRLMVGLAVLNLLAEAAAAQPVLCLVDDAQWLDSASTHILSFVARRLRADPVGCVYATRDNGDDLLAGLPTVWVRGLDDADARALLRRTVHGFLDVAVLDQIVAESHGNPLALLELPRTWTATGLAGGFGLPGSRSVAGRIEQSHGRRLGRLPADTRLLVLAAAADPLGDPALLDRAAHLLGADPAALAPAVDEGLLEVGRRVVFAHPLVRSAAYRYAELDDRHRVHRALAGATDAAADPDRHAWHRARAAPDPDEQVAAELEHSAGRAQSRGGLGAAAAFLSRSAELTPDPGDQVRRGLDAAFANLRAGAVDQARRLLVLALAGPLDALQHARTDLLRARLASASRATDAVPLLLAAAERLQPLDPVLSRQARLDALVAAQDPQGRRHGGGLAEVARAIRAAPRRPGGSPGTTDLLLEAFAAITQDDYDAAGPATREALIALRDGEPAAAELGQGAKLAVSLWADQDAYDLSDRNLRAARITGALSELQPALTIRAAVLVLCGEAAAAASLIEEARSVRAATGVGETSYAAVIQAGWQGHDGRARGLIEGGGAPVEYARAVLANGLGRHDEALAAARRAADERGETTAGNHALPELVEAAVRGGHDDLAAGALRELTRRAEASGTDWALGLAAGARAQLSRDDADFRRAVALLSRTRARPALARAHLLYGEWLGRTGRRADAGRELALAYEMCTAMSLLGFAERARRELLAAGAAAPHRQARLREELTAQEAQIAQMAREGLSNPEIGAQLFLSARTVEWHMRKVFTKLGISSRRQLREALSR